MMFTKAKAADNTLPEPSAKADAPGSSCPRPQLEANDAQQTRVRVRMEGAPWLSLRDRCGTSRPAPRRSASRALAPGSARSSTRSSQGSSSWRSLSRLEVAIGLVLLALLSAVFRGAQHEPMLALAPADAPPTVAPVSLIE